MKIIKIGGEELISLTVDNNSINVDNESITVDMESYLVPADDMRIKVIPREYSERVKLELFNELNQNSLIDTVDVINENGYMTIPINFTNIVEGDSFEIIVRDADTNKQLWRGKGYATMQDDLENYKLNVNDNNGVIKL